MVEDGVRAKVKMIAGTVQSVETPLTASGRQSTFIIAEYRLGTDIMKTARVDILSVRLEPSDLQDHQDLMPTAIDAPNVAGGDTNPGEDINADDGDPLDPLLNGLDGAADVEAALSAPEPAVPGEGIFLNPVAGPSSQCSWTPMV